MKLAIITAFKSNSIGLVLNNNLVVDNESIPGGLEAIKTIANGLSLSLCLEVDEINYKTDIEDNGLESWDDMIKELTSENLLNRNDCYGATTLMDAQIVDQYAAKGDDSPLEDIQKAKYNILIGKANDGNQVYLSIVDENIINNPNAHLLGLHAIIEIRNGLPAISLGNSRDENVIHVLSDTSKTIAVAQEISSDKPMWRTLDEIDGNSYGLAFSTLLDDEINENRMHIVDASLKNIKFPDGSYTGTYDQPIVNGNLITTDVELSTQNEIVKKRVSFQFHKNSAHYTLSID